MIQHSIFTQRFRSLVDDSKETQEKFGKRVGLSRNTVSLYYNGKRNPDSMILTKICKCCHVSADWLLGFSDVKKTDADLQAVCEYIGLAPETIQSLKTLKPQAVDCVIRILKELK